MKQGKASSIIYPSFSIPLSPCFPSSYGVYCRDNVSFPLDRFPNCSHLNTQPAAPSRTHCINKLHWGLISQDSNAAGQHTRTHTHLIRCDSQSLSTEKSHFCTGLWEKVDNFTRAGRFRSLQRDRERERERE